MAQLSAMFDTHEAAERAVAELRQHGVADADLSVIAHHRGTTTARSGDGEITDEHHRNVIRGILGGGALGAGLGVAALAIPGVGPLAAAGAIAASAVPEAIGIGAAVGALGGSMNEVLTKHGVDEADARYYDQQMREGGVLVTVPDTVGDPAAIRAVLRRHGGHDASQGRAAAI